MSAIFPSGVVAEHAAAFPVERNAIRVCANARRSSDAERDAANAGAPRMRQAAQMAATPTPMDA
jgi:hypothetical protein